MIQYLIMRSIRLFAILLLLSLMTGCMTTGQRISELSSSHDSISSIARASGRQELAVSDVEFYFEGDEWTDRAVSLIDQARSYIMIDTFLLGEHEHTDRILTALSQAVDRGVAVYMIIDSASYYRYDRTTGLAVHVPIREFRQAGIQLIEYNPIRAFRIYRLLGLLDRDHRKFWVIDGQRAVVGGMNIDPDSLASAEKRGSIDGMTLIDSPEAASRLADSFIATWNANSPHRLDRSMFHDAASTQDEGLETSVYLYEQGLGDSRTTSELFDAIFASARERIVMIQCYLIINERLLDRIESATSRGVDVQIILSANHVSSRFTSATYYGIRDLQKRGASVYIYDSPTGSLLHKKLITADEHIVCTGSANYNFRSEKLSREISLLFDDPEVYERIRPFIEWIERDSSLVSEQEASSYRGFASYLTMLMMQLGG